MNKIYIYIFINIYTLLLDLFLIGVVLIFFLLPVFNNNLVFIIFGGIISLFIARQAMVLHGTSNEKKKAYLALSEQNRIIFNPDSYAKYMNAPCTRRIVRLSLNQINRKTSYTLLKDSYQKHFYTSKRQTEFKITFFENNIPILNSDSPSDKQS